MDEASTLHKRLSKTGSRRGALPQGRAHQWAVQCQVVSPENTHASNILQTEQVVFRNTYVYAYTYVNTIAISEKRRHVSEGEQGRGVYTYRRSGERKGRKKCGYIIISKNSKMI